MRTDFRYLFLALQLVVSTMYARGGGNQQLMNLGIFSPYSIYTGTQADGQAGELVRMQ